MTQVVVVGSVVGGTLGGIVENSESLDRLEPKVYILPS